MVEDGGKGKGLNLIGRQRDKPDHIMGLSGFKTD